MRMMRVRVPYRLVFLLSCLVASEARIISIEAIQREFFDRNSNRFLDDDDDDGDDGGVDVGSAGVRGDGRAESHGSRDDDDGDGGALIRYGGEGPKILSAYMGVINVPPDDVNDVARCGMEQLPVTLAEAMPVTFSVQVDQSTLFHDQFRLMDVFGDIHLPSCATLTPGDDPDELYTVLLVGQFTFFRRYYPERVYVQPSAGGIRLRSIDGEDLTGLTIDRVTLYSNGPSLVMAKLFRGTGPDGADQIQTCWQGGVTGLDDKELDEEELSGFALITRMGETIVPDGFEDVDDGDNFVVLNVPPGKDGRMIVKVTVRQHTLYDPTNNPNPYTEALVEGV